MLNKLNGEDLSEKVRNNYELVIAISKRARQLQKGDKAMEISNSLSNVTISAMEFEDNKYNIVKLKTK